LRSFGNRAKRDVDARLVGVFGAAGPAPAHAEALGLGDLEIGAAALMLAAVQHAKADAKAAADARIGFRHEDRPIVRSPPAGDAIRRRKRIEDDRWSCLDPSDECETGHRFFLSSSSLRSA